MSLNAMKLTSRDMARARVMLRDQSKGEDPYDLLDDDGDPENKDKRRVLIIWALRSRTDPDFTWDMAWDVPFADIYADDDDEAGEAGEGADPLPEAAPSPSPNGAASSKRKPRAVAAEPSSASSSP
jgi:hypothetical protein